jgi:D-alanyl-D-alanine carboxypeptidase
MKIKSWMKYSQVLIFILLANLALGQVKKENIREIASILQRNLDSITSNNIVPGATLFVRFSNGKTISLASGFADVENKISMKPDALMFSGSVGKTYVSACVLKLYEKGLIDIKAKAIDYLKDETWLFKIPNAKEFTVEMLLNHTAGIPEYVYKKELWQQIKLDPDKVWSVQERLAFIEGDSAANPPGKGWQYADAHYLVLGLIIEKVTGKSYYEVLNELILKPYKLNKTIPSDKRSVP